MSVLEKSLYKALISFIERDFCAVSLKLVCEVCMNDITVHDLNGSHAHVTYKTSVTWGRSCTVSKNDWATYILILQQNYE